VDNFVDEMFENIGLRFFLSQLVLWGMFLLVNYFFFFNVLQDYFHVDFNG